MCRRSIRCFNSEWNVLTDSESERGRVPATKMQKESNPPPDHHQYVGPYRLEKTLGKGQTGKSPSILSPSHEQTIQKTPDRGACLLLWTYVIFWGQNCIPVAVNSCLHLARWHSACRSVPLCTVKAIHRYRPFSPLRLTFILSISPIWP